jgi:hypothetical protein
MLHLPTCAYNLCPADLPVHARFCPRCGQRRIGRRKNFGWVVWLAIPIFFMVGFRVQSKPAAVNERTDRATSVQRKGLQPDFGPSRNNGYSPFSSSSR